MLQFIIQKIHIRKINEICTSLSQKYRNFLLTDTHSLLLTPQPTSYSQCSIQNDSLTHVVFLSYIILMPALTPQLKLHSQLEQHSIHNHYITLTSAYSSSVYILLLQCFFASKIGEVTLQRTKTGSRGLSNPCLVTGLNTEAQRRKRQHST